MADQDLLRTLRNFQRIQHKMTCGCFAANLQQNRQQSGRNFTLLQVVTISSEFLVKVRLSSVEVIVYNAWEYGRESAVLRQNRAT